MTGRLTIAALQEMSTKRSGRWHKDGPNEWSIMEWAAAMAGEGGELGEAYLMLAMVSLVSRVSNTAKKLIRHDREEWNGPTTGFPALDREVLRGKLRQELADVLLYAPLVAQREGIDLEEAVIETFNRKSEEAGFPERL